MWVKIAKKHHILKYIGRRCIASTSNERINETNDKQTDGNRVFFGFYLCYLVRLSVCLSVTVCWRAFAHRLMSAYCCGTFSSNECIDTLDMAGPTVHRRTDYLFILMEQQTYRIFKCILRVFLMAKWDSDSIRLMRNFSKWKRKQWEMKRDERRHSDRNCLDYPFLLCVSGADWMLLLLLLLLLLCILFNWSHRNWIRWCASRVRLQRNTWALITRLRNRLQTMAQLTSCQSVMSPLVCEDSYVWASNETHRTSFYSLSRVDAEIEKVWRGVSHIYEHFVCSRIRFTMLSSVCASFV